MQPNAALNTALHPSQNVGIPSYEDVGTRFARILPWVHLVTPLRCSTTALAQGHGFVVVLSCTSVLQREEFRTAYTPASPFAVNHG